MELLANPIQILLQIPVPRGAIKRVALLSRGDGQSDFPLPGEEQVFYPLEPFDQDRIRIARSYLIPSTAGIHIFLGGIELGLQLAPTQAICQGLDHLSLRTEILASFHSMHSLSARSIHAIPILIRSLPVIFASGAPQKALFV